MNYFNAFTFGSLIKSILPGSIYMIIIMIYAKDLSPFVYNTVTENSVIFTFVALGGATLCGLISNTIVFLGINDFLVRNRFRKKHKQLHEIEGLVDRDIINHYIKIFDRMTPNTFTEDNINGHVDVEYMLLVRGGYSNFAFLRESYWFWLEFQINMLLSVFIYSLGSIVLFFYDVKYSYFTLSHAPDDYFWMGVFLVVAGLFCFAFLKAARNNYTRHRKKMLSLKIGAFVDSEHSSGCRDNMFHQDPAGGHKYTPQAPAAPTPPPKDEVVEKPEAEPPLA